MNIHYQLLMLIKLLFEKMQHTNISYDFLIVKFY
jgi:hypothetical protein